MMQGLLFGLYGRLAWCRVLGRVLQVLSCTLGAYVNPT